MTLARPSPHAAGEDDTRVREVALALPLHRGMAMRMRMPVLGAVFAIMLPAACYGVCGDGVVDQGEWCDDGGNNDYDLCCTSSCTPIDGDGDGICDAVDTCAWFPTSGPARLTEIGLRISGLATPIGDERFRFTGRIRIRDDGFIDPAVVGVRFGMFSWATSSSDPKAGTAPLVAAHVPGGRGWRSRPDRGLWMFRDSRGRNGGITRVTLKRFDPDPIIESPSQVTFAFEVVGRRGRYTITPEMVKQAKDPLQQEPYGQVWMEFGLGDPLDAVAPCNQRLLPWGNAPNYSCAFSTNGNVLVCSDPPPVGPCHVGDPLDLTVCELLAVAHAEDAYRAANGTYFDGPCAELPGYTPTDPGYTFLDYGMTCSLYVTANEFRVSITNPFVYGACDYVSSQPAPYDVTCW